MACVAVVVVSFAASIGVGSAPSADALIVRKPVVLVYGDSLVWESTKYITAGINGKVWNRHVFAVPTTAPCDWLQRLPGDIAKYRPVEITLATEANSNSPCMDDASGATLAYDSPEYLAKYRADLSAFFATAKGTPVLFLEGAPIGPQAPAWNRAVSDVYAIAQSLAPSYPNVRASNAANLSVSNDGEYVQTMPCLPKELTSRTHGCTGGQIDVRTEATSLQYGIHLCPIGITWPGTHPCSILLPTGKYQNVYSSGELRYGGAIAAATVSAIPPS